MATLGYVQAVRSGPCVLKSTPFAFANFLLLASDHMFFMCLDVQKNKTYLNLTDPKWT